jgi:hypothetical protein
MSWLGWHGHGKDWQKGIAMNNGRMKLYEIMNESNE